MALISGTKDIQTWSYEEDEDPKTIFHARGMTKKEYDKMMNSLRIKRVGDTEIDVEDLSRMSEHRYRCCIVKIENAVIDDEPVDEITDVDKIIEFIDNLNNTDAGEALDEWLIGLSEILPDDKKNLNMQLE